MQLTIQQFFKTFKDDEICLEHLFNVRFSQGHECPKCKREAKWYPLKSERAYSCQWCGNHIHPTVGTPFEKSRTSLQSWFYAIYLFTTTRHGVSAKELQRQLGVTYKTAWRMGHEIRKHMTNVDGDGILSGVIEVDETYVGGKRPGKRGRGADGKTVVFGILERDGSVITEVVSDAKTKTIQPHIHDHVEEGSEIHSDEWHAYKNLDKQGYDHETVNHGKGEYVSGNTHVNGLESCWRNLKSGINGTHIHVSAKHLEKYAKEFEFRFNRRMNPETMFPALLSSFPRS